MKLKTFLKFKWNSKYLSFYKTVLHYACEAGNIDLVKFLISRKKMDLESPDNILILKNICQVSLIEYLMEFFKSM